MCHTKHGNGKIIDWNSHSKPHLVRGFPIAMFDFWRVTQAAPSMNWSLVSLNCHSNFVARNVGSEAIHDLRPEAVPALDSYVNSKP